MKRFGLAAVVLLIGCSPGNGSSAIALKVRLDADLASTHTKVIAKGGALTLETICMPIAGCSGTSPRRHSARERSRPQGPPL